MGASLVTFSSISVNAGARALVEDLVDAAAQLSVVVTRNAAGCRVVDAGINARGSLQAGRRIAMICMGGLGSVRITHAPDTVRWPWQVEVATSQPVLACLGSQYAGWSLSVEGAEKFNALGSGPARALAKKEALFAELSYSDESRDACLVIETDRLPPAQLCEHIAAACGIEPAQLTLILTPTGSLAGCVQIAARVVEVGLHKAHALNFDLGAIVDALGSTPLPPPTADSLAAMGRTNDTILFCGQIHLFVSGPDEAAETLCERLPSNTSRDYGKPFATVFADYEYDFFRIDPLLFSPARVAVTAVDSGRTFFAGDIDEALLEHSFTSG